MESLRMYLKERIHNKIVYLEEKISTNKTSLEILNELDLNKGNYIVKIKPSWSDQNLELIESVIEGTLEESIKEAEKVFKKENNLSKVSGVVYDVSILINNNSYPISGELWECFTEEFSKSNLH
ncbi:hypothetical protein KY334_07605 [Candidatus Woesearchaeota archaeon]|nr:hypothetical protein [Candidatus Woesearchaeota archaeon]